jgi:hypothetical protein
MRRERCRDLGMTTGAPVLVKDGWVLAVRLLQSAMHYPTPMQLTEMKSLQSTIESGHRLFIFHIPFTLSILP